MTLTFGLDLILYNFMTVYYSATPRRITLDLGSLDWAALPSRSIGCSACCWRWV